MAILWPDGFDHYGTTPQGGRDAMLAGQWAEFFSSGAGNDPVPSVSTEHSRTGGHALLIPSGGSGQTGYAGARRVLGAPKTDFGCAFGLYMEELPNLPSRVGVAVRNAGNTPILTMAFEPDGSISALRGAGNGVLLGTSSQAITAQAWNHFEFKVHHDDSEGALEIRVNGATVLNIADENIGGEGAQLHWGRIRNAQITGTQPAAWYIDDVIAWDLEGPYANDWMGPQRVFLSLPDLDLSLMDWTVEGAGSGYEAISEVPPDGDDSYIEAIAIGATADFRMAAITGDIAAITAVYLPTMMRQVEAGVSNVQQALVSSGEVGMGANWPLTDVYTYWGDVLHVNPATDAPWTPSQLNAAIRRFVKTA